jgi:hypothetical protein
MEEAMNRHERRAAADTEYASQTNHDRWTVAADIATSNSLADLAARIKAEHEAAGAAIKKGLQHSIAAGALLVEAKDQVPHGQWLQWIKEHCGMPERTARLYMRLARHRNEIGNVADLTVRGAIDLLARSKDEADATAEAFELLDMAGAELVELEKFKLLVDGGISPTPAMADQFKQHLADALIHLFRAVDIAQPLGLIDPASEVWDSYVGLWRSVYDHKAFPAAHGGAG